MRWTTRRVDHETMWNQRYAFDRRRQRFTGLATPRDFNAWFGYALEEVAIMQFPEMEQLPGVVKRHVISQGGSYLKGLGLFSWRWVVDQKSQYLRRGEEFHGRGQSYNEAALAGLVTLFEIYMLRKKQGNVVLT